MEPDVIRLYSSSPPPLDEAAEEEEEDEFGDFGSFGDGGVSSSFSFSEIDTPTMFNQSNALEESPPDLFITTVQDGTISGKSIWANEKKLVREPQQPCVILNQEISRNETDSCVENMEKEPEIFMNGVESSDLQMERSIDHSVSSSDQQYFLAPPDIEQCIDNTCDGHSLSNGYSESDFGSNEEQNLPDSNNHSCYKDTSNPEETEAKIELSEETQSFSSCRDAQEAGDEDNQREDEGKEETGILDTPGSSGGESVAVCSDTCFLDVSTDCVDIPKAATEPTTDVDLISDAQLTRDTSEIHESSVNMETEVNMDNKAFNETADEDFGDFRDATQGVTDFSRTESITQEGFADFVTAMSRCSTDDEFGDTDTLKDFQEDDELAEEEKSEDCAGAFCSELPPSDSFADFSSAPFGGSVVEEGDNWASFGQHKAAEEDQDSWATFGEEQSTSKCKEKRDVTSPCSENLQSSRMERDTDEFGCKIQHLFRTAFPSHVNPKVSGVNDISPLQNILQVQDPQDQRDSSTSFSPGHEIDIWHHLQDIHGAHGLKFKWAGSHSNRTLLDCLGIRNIVFTGEKKQPVIVPMFAAGLGMLEPTKESQKSPASSALSLSVPVESLSCTQVAPSLTINVDGVDPELYELTTAKIETKSAGQSIADAFTKLMESMENTTTTARKQEQNEKISEEAAKVISLLPDLSFMRARVLMFPSVLTPAANHT